MPRSYVKKRIKKQNNTQKNKWGGALINASDTFNKEIKIEDLNITHLRKIFVINKDPTPILNYSNYVRYVCEPRQVYIKKHAYNTTSDNIRRRQPITPCKEGLISINGFILNDNIHKLILTFNESGYSVVFHSDNFKFFTEKIVDEPSSENELENVVDAAALEPGYRVASENEVIAALNENASEEEHNSTRISMIPTSKSVLNPEQPEIINPARVSASLPRFLPASDREAKPLSNTPHTASRRPNPPREHASDRGAKPKPPHAPASGRGAKSSSKPPPAPASGRGPKPPPGPAPAGGRSSVSGRGPKPPPEPAPAGGRSSVSGRGRYNQ